MFATPLRPLKWLCLSFSRLSVKLIETTLLGRKRKVPSSCTSTSTVTTPSNTGEASSSASVAEETEDSAPSAKRKKVQRPGHQCHRPETKAKINLFNKIRSAEKRSTEVNRSPKEMELWEMFKSGKLLSIKGIIDYLH